MFDDEEEGFDDDVGLYPVIGPKDAKHKITFINPNSSFDMSAELADYFKDKIAPDVRITFYTGPPGESPESINGTMDGIISSAAVLKDIGLFKVDTKERRSTIPVLATAVIIGCFSAHPLLPALQEAFLMEKWAPPVIGIMESAVYTALQLAPSIGIVTTGKSKFRLLSLARISFFDTNICPFFRLGTALHHTFENNGNCRQ